MARLECVRCGTEIPEGILRRCPKCGSSETRPKRRRIGRRRGGRGVGFVPVIAIVIGVIGAAFLPAIVDAVRDRLDDDEGARAATDLPPQTTPQLIGSDTQQTLPTSAAQAAACIERWNGEGNGVTRSTLYGDDQVRPARRSTRPHPRGRSRPSWRSTPPAAACCTSASSC